MDIGRSIEKHSKHTWMLTSPVLKVVHIHVIWMDMEPAVSIQILDLEASQLFIHGITSVPVRNITEQRILISAVAQQRSKDIRQGGT